MKLQAAHLPAAWGDDRTDDHHVNKNSASIPHTDYRYILAQDKFSYARKLNEAMPVASSIEADAADGNLDQRNVRLISVGYTSTALCN